MRDISRFLRRKQESGFTLTELMIVVVVLAVISAVAIPSYRENVRKARRAEVRGLMIQNSQFMERFFTENSRYDRRINGTAVALPVLQSPQSGDALYTISLTPAAGQTTYTIRADPVAGKSMAGDACGSFTVTNLGVKGNVNVLSPMTSDKCWK